MPQFRITEAVSLRRHTTNTAAETCRPPSSSTNVLHLFATPSLHHHAAPCINLHCIFAPPHNSENCELPATVAHHHYSTSPDNMNLSRPPQLSPVSRSFERRTRTNGSGPGVRAEADRVAGLGSMCA
ncbi:hypothetical protein DEO72_LG5g155 [Vigna unguiculata]|uniref:Uncharacterized protein n=1 Tax=Vigna unguiculata TaxID=3917 RepID=A0A4D6LVR6_VIGUN|nr:hypothetical protein DEO72_LG5g155 [Vigna unguiculata]